MRRATLEKTAVRSSLKAEDPDRAMPYPMRTEEGVAKAARRYGFEEAIEEDDEESESIASLKRKGTWTFKNLAPTRQAKAVMTLKRSSGLSLIHRKLKIVRRILSDDAVLIWV